MSYGKFDSPLKDFKGFKSIKDIFKETLKERYILYFFKESGF